MVRKFKHVLFFAALISSASVGTSAWAAHGGHGGGHGGHGWGGGHGGASWHGGHGNFDGHNHFAGWGYGYGWGHGYSNRYYGGYWPYFAWNYLNGWPYRAYYRPYTTYSYPSYGYPYYGDGCYCNATVAEPASEYVISTPVNDAAQVEEPLPAPEGKLLVEGSANPTGTIRELQSRVVNEPEQLGYTSQIQGQGNDPASTGGPALTDGRTGETKVETSVVVNSQQPQELGHVKPMSTSPRVAAAYAKVTAAELRDWLQLR